jgi:hypothetical protein
MAPVAEEAIAKSISCSGAALSTATEKPLTPLSEVNQASTAMATPDVSMRPGVPDTLYSNVVNSPRLNPSPKETQESLKRSFAKYLAADHGTSGVGKLFIPSKHLAFEEPTYIHTMEDEPFRLFSEDAVNIMRAEIFDPEVQAKYSYTSDIAPKQLRGYVPK